MEWRLFVMRLPGWRDFRSLAAARSWRRRPRQSCASPDAVVFGRHLDSAGYSSVVESFTWEATVLTMRAIMARRILQIVPTPEQLLDLTPDELARALLEDMRARESERTTDRANRNHLGAALVTPAIFGSIRRDPRDLKAALDKAGRDAYAVLERCGLIEADEGLNGTHGYVLLTAKGRTTTELVDFERVRVRCLLKQEMLHPSLRGKTYSDFAADEFDAAVLDAFKTVEIAVREAAGFSDKEHGKPMMCKAFGVGGKLSSPGDTKADSEALSGLFAGALNRFRNPGAHTKRNFADVLEAMEELMFASRLLRLVDERRRP